MSDYTYTAAHFPNNVSWYRELVHQDGKLVAEISEPTDSTSTRRIYRVGKYEPFRVADGYVDLIKFVAKFDTVSDCKDYINNGGIQ
jgi:hypothetical protein